MAQTSGKVNILPIDIAEAMKGCSDAAAQCTSNLRLGSQGEGDAQRVHWEEYAASLMKLSNGLLSGSICSNIKMMFWYQGWRTANIRDDNDDDAARDGVTANQFFGKIRSSGEITDQLAKDIQDMGWGCAWFWANTLDGNDDDAKRDKANLEAAYSKIHGDINLENVKFFTDKAKILQETPKAIADQTLRNNADIQQSMTFQFSTTQGTTTSISTTIGFKYTVTSSVEVGFEGIGKASYSVSFELSSSTTFATAVTNSQTKSYTFPIVVPPHTAYTARAMVNEATMDVPYELVFNFGGTLRSFYGTWKGVAVSSATYVIDKAVHLINSKI